MMKDLTNAKITLQPLNIDDLRNTIGGDGDVVTPEDLLGGNSVVIEDIIESI